MNYSYIMGIEDIQVLRNRGFCIEEIDGDYGVSFKDEEKDFYEKFIEGNLSLGFWNEYLGDKQVFMFKFLDGSFKRIEYSEETEGEILKLCRKFAECDFPSYEDLLHENEFYAKYYFKDLK